MTLRLTRLTRLSQGLLPDMELLSRMFLTLLDMKNINKMQKKDKVIYFNISVAAERCGDRHIKF